jgi:hypothetical protein
MLLPMLILLPTLAAAQDPPPAAAATAQATEQQATPRTTIMYPRPIPMGSSCGNWQSAPFIYTGTCGMRVRFISAPQFVGILSNNHVLGATGPSLCPSSAVPFQELALQPGTLDIGNIPADPTPFAVGLFVGAFPMTMTTTANNLLDAAIAFTNTSLADSAILNIGQPVQAALTPAPGMPVKKTGRTTDTTMGTIQAVNSTVLVGYDTCGTARFTMQIVITPGAFSAGGDSGSVILHQTSNIPVGLLFAGSALQTIANDIRIVYAGLGVFPDGVPPPASVSELLSATNPEVDRVTAIKSRVENTFFANPEVVGVGVGLDDAGEVGIVVFTRGSTVMASHALPAAVEGVRVKYVTSGGGFHAFRR